MDACERKHAARDVDPGGAATPEYRLPLRGDIGLYAPRLAERGPVGRPATLASERRCEPCGDTVCLCHILIPLRRNPLRRSDCPYVTSKACAVAIGWHCG